MNPKSVIISRTDSIGDVVLTLPMCGILKQRFPGIRIYFIGRGYTRAIIESCIHVDEYMNWDKLKEQSPGAQIEAFRKTNAEVILHVFPRKEVLWLAKRAQIPVRIATGRRLQTISKCNKLVFFSRKGSDLHEAQLNLKLLKPLGIESDFTLSELVNFYGFEKHDATAEKNISKFLKSFSKEKKRIIFHPLSKGSAAEWNLQNFKELATHLKPEQYDVFITGTKEEGEMIKSTCALDAQNVHDVTGKFTLQELIAFIRSCDALIAASTGPAHIAAASGIVSIALFTPKRPMHAGRWAPLGKKARVIVAEKHPQNGTGLSISPDAVLQDLTSALA